MTPLARLHRFSLKIPRKEHDAGMTDEPVEASDYQGDIEATAQAMLAAAALAEAGGPPHPAPTGVAAQMLAAYRKSRGEQ